MLSSSSVLANVAEENSKVLLMSAYILPFDSQFTI